MTNQKSKICLNMIVKDESKVILRVLNSVKDYISYWVISDTGSSDNTKELIVDFFKECNIPGELYEDSWKNYGENRSIALKHAYVHSDNFDYIWVIDADNYIVGEIKFPDEMTSDCYVMNYGTEGFKYIRQQLFHKRNNWVYRGVIHEFPQCTNNMNVCVGKLNDDFYIYSESEGNDSYDVDRYLKYANLLVDTINENKEPDLLSRYLFYAGNSFFDHANKSGSTEYYKNAIDYYNRRIECGEWKEEVYYSYFRIACAKELIEYPFNEIIEAYTLAHNFMPTRVEAIYHLTQFLLRNQKYSMAYETAKIGIEITPLSCHALFVSTSIYTEFPKLFQWIKDYNSGIILNLRDVYGTNHSLCFEK